MQQSRIIKIGDAISQLLNVTFLSRHRETTANESISGRAHRMGWKRTEAVINWLFSIYENDHCRRAYEKDLLRAQEWLELNGKSVTCNRSVNNNNTSPKTVD